ncbi:MAG TPA: nucleoside hydrolase [Methylomirabilota bacterium]|nr:nucleoside hydrolase [Methylomirabilota bacterium]
MPVPWLIDTDPGIDDALALLLALASPEVSVEAITSVAGNVPVGLATANVHRVLDAAAPATRPRLARGAAAPLRGPLVTATDFHGDDGLGGISRLRDGAGRSLYPRLAPAPDGAVDGPDLILEMADRFGGELVVVALGPLTNLAIALERGPRRMSRVGRVVVMGGAIAVPGNTTPAAEFNFFVDPQAAAAVLRSGLPIELVPLDATGQVRIRRARLAAALARGRPALARFIDDFTDHLFLFGDQRGDEGIALHDPLAVGVALDPALVTLEPLHVEVEDEGRVTRGAAVADRRRIPASEKAPANCGVAMAVDTGRFLDLFLARVSAGAPARVRPPTAP